MARYAINLDHGPGRVRGSAPLVIPLRDRTAPAAVGDRFTGESHRDLLGAVYGMALLEAIGTADTPFGPANFPQLGALAFSGVGGPARWLRSATRSGI
jgi:hypothetical protein